MIKRSIILFGSQELAKECKGIELMTESMRMTLPA